MWRKLGFVIGMAGLSGPAAAQDGAGADWLAAEVARAPDRVAGRVEDIVLGFGDGERMTAADVERMVATERAAARGRMTGQLLTADLDGDGRIAAGEGEAAAEVLSARSRARLLRALAAADANRDGDVDAAEIVAAAQGAGLRAVSEARAARDMALLALDRDGDGALTVGEARAAIAEMPAPAAARAATPATGDRDT